MVRNMYQSAMDISQPIMTEISPAPMTLFPFDMKVNKLITQHLSGTDFLKLSEVSRSFSTYVNNYCMDKIQLAFHETIMKKVDVDALLESRREYKHIRITQLVYAHSSMQDVFARFAPSLVSIYTAYDFVLDIGLLSVTSLKMVLGEACGYYEHGLLSTVANLKVLHLQGRHNYPIELVNCLDNNSSLEELVLEKNAQDSLFSNRRMPNFNLQLKSLKMDSALFEDMAEQNFEKFLARSTRVKEIKVLRCKFDMLANICNSPVLSVQHVTFSPPYAHVSMNYHFQIALNLNITYLGLILVNEPILREMLPKLPRLKTLYVSDPTPTMFKFIIANTPGLKNFRYAYFRDAYYDYDLVCSIYDREVLMGNPKAPKNLIITQI